MTEKTNAWQHLLAARQELAAAKPTVPPDPEEQRDGLVNWEIDRALEAVEFALAELQEYAAYLPRKQE